MKGLGKLEQTPLSGKMKSNLNFIQRINRFDNGKRKTIIPSSNSIFITYDAMESPAGPYLLAHALGHAVQVRHGVADVALSTIRANRDNETALRKDVTRMVECIAGVLIARAGLPAPPLDQLFDLEPFTDSHWGRDPLRIGPQVTLGMAERNAWYQKGHAAGHPAACHTTLFSADLVVAAFRE